MIDTLDSRASAGRDSPFPTDRRILLRRLFDAAVRRALPEAVMPARLPSAAGGRLVVMAIGKAAAEMMRVAQARSDQALAGLAVTRHGHLPDHGMGWEGVEVIEAGHPYPDDNSIRAAERALTIAHALGAGDHLLVLLSGGGSALLAAPADGLDLAEKQGVTRALLQSGATIEEINCVRKHLSRIKGGRLAVAAAPARVTTWIISDVPGDDPSSVASGPTVADRTSLAAARAILDRHAIVPTPAVAAALADARNETPDAQAAGLGECETAILARAADALAAASDLAAEWGFSVDNLGDRIEGEARAVASDHATLALGLLHSAGRTLLLSGGETTVTVRNREGRGGRNMEYLLSLAIALDGRPGVHALACDTDGIDGTDDAAGAIITPDTLDRARAKGLDAAQHLARNDAYPFFAALGDLVITGPTLTNVNDFRAILIDGEMP